jgi:ATP-binding cassette subfamily B (MDR/TAP) protein 1
MSASKNPPLPPSVSVEPTPVDQIQVVEDVAAENDQVVKAIHEGAQDNTLKKKKKPEPGLKNYIVSAFTPSITHTTAHSRQRVFSYGTKLDAFLMGLSCLTSIGAGIAIPLMVKWLLEQGLAFC